MNQLVCLSHLPWQAVPGRTQQLLTRLHQTNILFFEPASSPGDKSFRRPGRKMRSNLLVYTLPPLRALGSCPPLLRERSQARQAAYILSVLKRHRFRDALLWLTAPESLFLVDALPHRGLVYDCSQDWDNLPLDWESELASQADVVFTASEGLAYRLASCCENIAVVPNGVNHLFFEQSELTRPPDLKKVTGPVLCRVGTVGNDLDLEPLCHAALQRPNWTFLLLGKAAPGAVQGLAPYRNIWLLGQVPPAQVPDYLYASQVCFDLVCVRNIDSDILPSHFFEYLATGKPVVMMLDETQVETFPDVVYTAHTPAGFLHCCDRALEEAPGWVNDRRRRYAHSARWSARAEEIQRILEITGLF